MMIFQRLFQPKISLLHATRGRPQQARECRQNWLNSAAKPERVEHLFAVDCDDADSIAQLADLKPQIVKEAGAGCVAAWNLAANHATGKVLVQLSDDWLPLPRWDEILIGRIGNVNKPRVLRISDGHRSDDLFCMAILTRKRLIQQGWFLSPAYTGIYSDDEFSFRAFEDGVIVDARDVVFTHRHPNYDATVPMDETYRQQNDSAKYADARRIFLERNPEAKKRWFVKDHWERRWLPRAKITHAAMTREINDALHRSEGRLKRPGDTSGNIDTQAMVDKLQREGVRRMVSQLRQLAAEENLDLNALLRLAIPKLPSPTALQLASVAAEGLPAEELAAMGSPPRGSDSPWLPPAAPWLSRRRTAALNQELRSKLQPGLSPKRTPEFDIAAGLDRFISEEQHLARLFKSTARHAAGLVDSLCRSAPGRLLARTLQRDGLVQTLGEADSELSHDHASRACDLYLRATDQALRLLQQSRKNPLLRLIARSAPLNRLETTLRAQEKCWKVLQNLNRKNPTRKRRGAFGVNLDYYSAQAMQTFFDGREAGIHYAATGWKEGLNPHPLFDTKYFLSRNQDQARGNVNPLEVYRRLLDEGGSPEAHPRFSGAWLRRYFSETSGRDLARGTAAPPAEPVRLQEAKAFLQQKPRISIGIILYQTSGPELNRLFRTIERAMDRAENAGYERPLLTLTDNSHEWDELRIASEASRAGATTLFLPTDSNVGFGRGHNHLMRHAFRRPDATHYLCLNPDGMLHPDALVRFHRAIEAHKLPALIEARQFPSEHPKTYDGVTHETDWCSAGCVIIPRFLFELTSGFDDRFFMYCEDVDLSWRVWELGYRCLMAPTALFHHRVAGRGKNAHGEQRMLEAGRILAAKWGNPRFGLVCEQALIEQGFYPDTASLPAIEMPETHDPHNRVDFSQRFTFSTPRW